MVKVVQLSPADMNVPSFERLLRAASGSAKDERVREELRALTVVGVVDGELVGFAGFGDTGGYTVLRYIAVAEHHRGRGHGATLVDALQQRSAGHGLRAETDDDAVGFYRKMGFTIEPLTPDPRWPNRHRFLCTRTRRD